MRSIQWTAIVPAAPAALTAALTATPAARAADVVLSEYNAVSPSSWLGNPDLPRCSGPGGEVCSSKEDTFFGRVMGNGDNWFELVVITDHLDMRGWSLVWEETLAGKAGTIFLSDHAFWSDLRAGTIVTIIEGTTAEGGLDSDLGFDPCAGDWWVNVNTFDTALVATTETNVAGDGPGNFSVGNDQWYLRIEDETGQNVFGPAGEGATFYPGSGVSTREICRLQEHPSAATNGGSPYDDGTRSSFGSANTWVDVCRTFTSYDVLRAPATEACEDCRTPVILNEYNAVGTNQFLNGGTQGSDSDLGQASDSFFGRVAGNGGDWLELVIVEDGVDLRGWTLDWEQSDNGDFGSIVLTDDDFWATIPGGAIVTFIEATTAEGGLDTDRSVDIASGDRWINVNTFDVSLIASTTRPGDAEHVSGAIVTSHRGWRLTIRDSGGVVAFGPAGEGADAYYQDPVNNVNVCRLESGPSGATTPLSPYDDGATISTFGAANLWTECPDPDTVVQAFTDVPCEPAPPPVAGDINGDGVVNVSDLLLLITTWGTADPNADLNGDGIVNVPDLIALISNWS